MLIVNTWELAGFLEIEKEWESCRRNREKNASELEISAARVELINFC